MNLSRNSQEEEKVYQILRQAAEIKGRHSCSECGGSFSFDNIYMCKRCATFWGYCCVPSSRICTNCDGEIV